MNATKKWELDLEELCLAAALRPRVEGEQRDSRNMFALGVFLNAVTPERVLAMLRVVQCAQDYLHHKDREGADKVVALMVARRELDVVMGDDESLIKEKT